MPAIILQIPITARMDGLWHAGLGYCGKDGGNAGGHPVHTKCIAEFSTDSDTLLKRHKTVRDAIVLACAYH
jgi:hypothetical protein